MPESPQKTGKDMPATAPTLPTMPVLFERVASLKKTTVSQGAALIFSTFTNQYQHACPLTAVYNGIRHIPLTVRKGLRSTTVRLDKLLNISHTTVIDWIAFMLSSLERSIRMPQKIAS